MKQYEDYDDYLKSKEWANIKNDFYDCSDISYGVCFLCYNSDNLQLHHWRYPKNWANDSYKNLMEVCDVCHEVIHGIEESKLLHNSGTFDNNSQGNFIKYLSWIIKSTKVMEIARLEYLANEF